MPPPVRVAKICAVPISVKLLLRPQIDALAKRGYEVLCFCSDGPEVARLRADGLQIHPVEIPRRVAPWLDLKAIVRLALLLRRQDIQVVHTHTPKAAFIGQVAAWLARVPVRINTVHGLYYVARPKGVMRSFLKLMERISCRLADLTLSQSDEDSRLMTREHWLPPQRVKWIGNGIDLRKYSPAAFDSNEGQRVREEFGIPRGAFVVGIVARMVAEKGFAELFEAFTELRKKASDAFLLHIGFIDRSRNEEVTPAWAEKLGISPYCCFAGERDDVARLMTAMDVYCLPSYREGYPRSVIEANAMGLPAIVTDIRGCREAVQHDLNGLLVPARDVTSLAKAMYSLYEDAEYRARLSAGAIRRSRELFNEQRVIRTVLDCYDELLRGKGLIPPRHNMDL